MPDPRADIDGSREAPPIAPPLELREALPPVVADPAGLAETARRLAAGTGPVAVDAERASGYRYSARAYLVQMRRAGTGTVLVDPVPFAELAGLRSALADAEWVLHAASQDLPCLRELGLVPDRLFDTELAGRLLNFPRVGLASLVEELLGFSMRKEHSAVDWSRRPLPEPWLLYAALDVEALLELRDRLHGLLSDADKLGWAEEEFAALAAATASAPRPERWRRTSGLHRARGRRALGVVRELWDVRDRVAARRDVTPTRVLPDAAIIAAASAMPGHRAALQEIPGFRSRWAVRHTDEWLAAIARVKTMPEVDLPAATARYDGPPPARAWPEKDPAAAARLGRCREVVHQLAESVDVPVENLVAPDAVRRLAWEPPEPIDRETVAEVLRSRGARAWQVELTAAALADALAG